MCLGGGGGESKIAKAQRNDEVQRQARIKAGMGSIASTFSNFNDAFFAKRASDYSAYATPELERQADAQKKGLVYALARTGNLDSSAAIDKTAELNTEKNQRRIEVANQGLDSANQLRGQVENTRGNLVAELNATGDSSAAASSALRSVQNLSQPAGFSPLGNMFAGFAQAVQQIGSRAGNNYSGFAGGGGGGLFAPGANSQRVVGG